MSNNIEYNKPPRNGKAIAGVILLVVGGILLLRQLDLFLFPGWLFSWPMFLIIPGLYIGAKSNFQKPAWFILVLLGVAFLAEEAIGHSSGRVIWPLTFIVGGLWMIMRRNNKYDQEKWQQFSDKKKQPPYPGTEDPVVDYTIDENGNTNTADAGPSKFTHQTPFTEDFINTTAIFGGVDKIILSKNFRGGEILNIFGGTEIDFTKADIDGHVVMEITQVFGGTKLIIPPHWHVISNVSSIFAAVDDKRMRHTATITNEKVLIIKGASIFAGIDIRSY